MMTMEQIVEKSTDRYQAMLNFLENMAEMLKTADPSAIKLALEQWNLMQQETQQIDGQLDSRSNTIERTKLLPKMQRRTELMAQVFRQCQEIYSQANLLRALVGDELNRLHQGRKALGSYKGTRDHRGSRLSASS